MTTMKPITLVEYLNTIVPHAKEKNNRFDVHSILKRMDFRKNVTCVIKSKHADIAIMDSFVMKSYHKVFPVKIALTPTFKYTAYNKKEYELLSIFRLEYDKNYMSNYYELSCFRNDGPNFTVEIVIHKFAMFLCPDHVVAIHGYTTNHYADFSLVMEKMDGVLHDIARELTADEWDTIFLQIAHTLEILHKHKINHNDLHLHNILYKQNTAKKPLTLHVAGETYNFAGEDVPFIIKISDFGDATIYASGGIVNEYTHDFDQFPNYFNYTYDWIPFILLYANKEFFPHVRESKVFHKIMTSNFPIPQPTASQEELQEFWDKHKDPELFEIPSQYTKIENAKNKDYCDVVWYALTCNKEVYNIKYNTQSRLFFRVPLGELRAPPNPPSECSNDEGVVG